MEIFFCGAVVAAVLLFSYLLNTARKKKLPPAAGRKEYTPVYVSIADDPDAVMQGMDKFVAEVQKTETAGDRWRWVPLLIFFWRVCIDGCGCDSSVAWLHVPCIRSWWNIAVAGGAGNGAQLAKKRFAGFLSTL